ncbi:MAG: ADP-ribosylglycohydrolase family protein [Campylobacterota bacterium]|nr:ADP-ribosylglycohydrolase family protein [Campylobacterota bacterium]
MNEKIEKSILSSLICDRYSLGSHWVYDEEELKNLPIDWEKLNAPQSLWHRGKESGDMTHYGDQTLFLVEFVKRTHLFNKEAYYDFWKEKMSKYKGYIDGSSREALEEIGASSNDLSICGRIAPLLLCSETKQDFLENVAAFVSITHNSPLALNASAFFAELLWFSQKNEDTKALIYVLKPEYPELAKWIDDAIEKQDENSFDTIREFGPACGIDGGFAGVIYLLLQDKSFKDIMIENAQAGGDSSARGMVVAMILGLSDKTELPEHWLA